MNDLGTGGSRWHATEQARLSRELGLGTTLYAWDGDQLAWEADYARGRAIHYVFEPASFVPVLQATSRMDPHSAFLKRPSNVIEAYADGEGNYAASLYPLHNGDYEPGLDRDGNPPPKFEDIYFYQCGHLGTPMELTDRDGEIAWEANYKAWGQAKIAISEAARKAGVKNAIRFQGQYFDEETGLHYNRFRYYEPLTGRFVSKDPIGLFGGANLQAYVDNPIEWIDPFGWVKIKNKVDGDRREQEVIADIKKSRPGAKIQCECYLRNAKGKSIRDPITNERRRVDVAVIENGRADMIEVTSLTADKVDQIQKEQRIRDEGGCLFETVVLES